MKNISKRTKVILLSIIGVLIIALSITYAYFHTEVDKNKEVDIEVISKTVDQVIITKGETLRIDLDHDNFGEGKGNVTGSTTSKITLIANNKTNQATKEYQVVFLINLNEFKYAEGSTEPEVILSIEDPNGNEITGIIGQTYVTRDDVSGFDITEFKGALVIKGAYEISTNSSTTGTSQEWKATVTVRNLDINQIGLMGKKILGKFSLSTDEREYTFNEDGLDTLVLNAHGGKTAIEQKTINTPPNFGNVEKNNMGMYAMVDDYGLSYYFRGAVDNNWVKFGKEDGNDIYWRIVRINGDGSVKLIYTGTTPPTEAEKVRMTGAGTQTTTKAFNTSRNSAEYIGYMYEEEVHRGHKDDSTIKAYLDTWYEDNLQEYEEYLSDFVVCNDRGFQNNWEPVGLPSTSEGTQYSNAYGRNFPLSGVASTPTLICPNQEDAYTKSDNIKGNAKLKHPIGLLTADEVTLAGAYKNTSNNAYYLYTNSWYWLVSPYRVNASTAGGFIVGSSGYLINSIVDSSIAVRPVVSLLSGISASGSGQWNDPYVVD